MVLPRHAKTLAVEANDAKTSPSAEVLSTREPSISCSPLAQIWSCANISSHFSPHFVSLRITSKVHFKAEEHLQPDPRYSRPCIDLLCHYPFIGSEPILPPALPPTMSTAPEQQQETPATTQPEAPRQTVAADDNLSCQWDKCSERCTSAEALFVSYDHCEISCTIV